MFTIEIFLAVFIFILLVLVSIEDALTGFLLLLMLVPLQHKEFFSLVYWDVLPIRIAFFGLILTTGYRSYLWFRRNKDKSQIIQFLKDPVLILIFLLYFVRLISLFFADNLFAGVKLLAFYTVIVYFYILMKHLYLKHGRVFIEKSMFVYVISGIVTAVIALIQFFSFKIYDIKFGAIWEIPGHNPRIGSTFWDVNHYAAFIASLIPITLFYLVTSSKKLKLVWAFVTIFFGLILYLTQSRSAWLGLAVSLSIAIVMLFIKGFRKYARNLIFLGFIVMIVFSIYAQITKGGVVTYYKEFMHTRLDSFDTHLILIWGAMESYGNNPLIGSGYGNFNEAFRKTSYSKEYFFREKNIVDKRVPSHSLWGEVISETGFLGFAIYLLTFFTILSLLFRGFTKSSGLESFLPLGVFTSIITLLIAGIFYTYNLEFYWFLVFLGALTSYELNKDININSYFSWLYSIKRLPVLFLSFIAFVFLFWDLGKNKLIDWDEAIYAEVSKNIIKTGDYITLYWDIPTPWFEKPPLYFWISSSFMRVFGVNEISARLPSTLFAFFSVIIVYYLAKYIFKSRFVGLLSGVMLLTTAHFWYYGRLAMLDVTVGFFILASMYFAYKYFEEKKLYLPILSGVMVGLALLTKAIIGLIPVVALSLYLFYLLISKQVKVREIYKGILTFFVTFIIIAFPWHLTAYLMYGDSFLKVYIVDHILGRGLSDAQGKTQPFFWYLDVLYVSMRGWFLILVPAFFYSCYKAVKNDRRHIFLLIYSLTIFLFFSVSNTKLVWYIIPIYPPLVIINSIFILDFLRFVYKNIVPKIKNLSSFNYKTYSSGFAIFFILSIFLYIVNVVPLVFFVDFNDDLVKVIRVYNEDYVDGSGKYDKNLYYLRIAKPVVKFYSKGEVVGIKVEDFIEKIEDQDFTESFVYISRKGEVTNIKDKFGDDKIKVVKNEGAYYITYVKSIEEDLVSEKSKLNSAVDVKIKTNFPIFTDLQLEDINSLINQIYLIDLELHNKLPNKYPEPVLQYFDRP